MRERTRVLLTASILLTAWCPGGETFAQEDGASTSDTNPERGTSAAVALAEDASSSKYDRRHALVIGIDEYQDSGFQDLKYAVADARGVAEVLVRRFGFEADRVRLLLNEDATQDGMLEALEDWAGDTTQVGKNDLFVLFFAGHGVTRDLGDQGKVGYLVPSDGRTQSRGRSLLE